MGGPSKRDGTKRWELRVYVERDPDKVGDTETGKVVRQGPPIHGSRVDWGGKRDATKALDKLVAEAGPMRTIDTGAAVGKLFTEYLSNLDHLGKARSTMKAAVIAVRKGGMAKSNLSPENIGGDKEPCMAEALSSSEVAGEISRHTAHSAGHEHDGDGSDAGDGTRDHDRTLSIIEAVMLAVVALLAAYTGYASAKWNTESAIRLAGATAARTEANRAALDAQTLRNFDSTTFNSWFTAYVAGDTSAETVAARRFRPAFKVAFDAWLATDPFTSAHAPPGPTYMPQYKQPELATATALDTKANEEYTLGVQAGSNADNYIRDTIYLATILFLVGISGHFRFFRIRVGLVVLSGLMLLVAIFEIATSPPIP